MLKNLINNLKLNVKSIFILSIIASFTVQDLKIGLGGISIGQKGDAFIYELLIALFSLYTVMYIAIKGIFTKRTYLLSFLVFVTPIIFNYLYGGSPEYFVGSGSFRMFIVCTIFFLFASIHRYEHFEIKYYGIMLVIIAIVNALYSILISVGILPQIFPYNTRMGYTRIAGLSQSPAYAGTLLSTAIALLIPYFRKIRMINLIVAVLLIISLILSMNRSGFVAVMFTILFYFFLIGSKRVKIACIVLIFIVTVLSKNLMDGALLETMSNIGRDSTDEGITSRIDLIKSAFLIFINNPFGIPWGEFANYDTLGNAAGEPHNLIALIAIYGGFISLLSFMYILISVFRFYLKRFNNIPISHQSFLVAIFSLLIFSQFEITLYHVWVILPLFLFLIGLIDGRRHLKAIDNEVINKNTRYIKNSL